MGRPAALLALILAIASVAAAQAPESAATPADSAVVDSAAAAGAAAIPTSAPDYVAEVRAKFTPENQAYSGARTTLAFIAPFYAVVVALVLLFSGLSAKFRDIAHDLSQRPFTRALVYVILFSVAGFLLTLPFDWFDGFVLEHRFRLSNQTPTAWFDDHFKELLFQVAFLGVFPLVMLGLRQIERSPRRWWIHFTLVTAPLTALSMFILPLVIEPAFNKFKPLANTELTDHILALGARAGIPARKVLEADRSAQTKKLNAYVSGFGVSQRIVIWDTTLQAMTEDEILFVMGHEMGHYRLGHLWKGAVFSAFVAAIVFFVIALVAPPLVRRFGGWWGFDALHDLAAVPLFAGLLTIVIFLLGPIINGFERAIEHEADVYAVEITRDNDAGARAFIKLGEFNRSNPEPAPLVKQFLYDHPPLVERVEFALDYRPWEVGRPNRVFHGPPASAPAR